MNNGIYTDISIEDYHKNRTHISATQIKRAKRSLKELHWYLTGKIESEYKAHFDFGNAFELALLDPKGFDKDVAILQTEYWKDQALKEKPDLKIPTLSAKYKGLKSYFESKNDGKYLIPDTGKYSFESIECMLESCHQDRVIQALIENTEYQLSLFWTDESSGLNLKTRPDICKRKKNVIINLKTAIDGSPSSFSRDLANYDYPLQACVEICGCIESGLMPQVDNYFWLVVEKEPPFNATIYEFSPDDIKWCMDDYEYRLNRIKLAKEKDFYPGYTDKADNEYGILTAEIPLYYKNK